MSTERLIENSRWISIYEISSKCVDRAFKLKPRVERIKDDDCNYRVQSQSRPEIHHLVTVDDFYKPSLIACSCESFTLSGAECPGCLHAAAVRIILQFLNTFNFHFHCKGDSKDGHTGEERIPVLHDWGLQG